MTVRRHERKTHIPKVRRKSRAEHQQEAADRAIADEIRARQEKLIKDSEQLCSEHQRSPTTREELIKAGLLTPFKEKGLTKHR